MDRRLRAGDDCRAEAVIAASPGLAADTESTLELVYTEFAVRDELGLNPEPEDWYTRFPALRAELQALFDVHRSLCDGVEQSPTAADATRPRKLVGEYEILREIGRGGMGVVYQARQLGLNRMVAVKMVLGLDHAGPHPLDRFRAECEAVARLQHPNIVQIFELGEHDGHPFFSLEFVAGGGLDQLLARSLPTCREAAELVVTLAQAIGYAHERGVVHRDLKPANVLLQHAASAVEANASDTEMPPVTLAHSIPKITDFGLAKQLASADLDRTTSGTIIGTPGYMSPEQASGSNRDIGPPADIHALGAILYESLVGQPPFQAATLLETLEQIRTRQPSFPAALQTRIPRDLQTICLKCLEKAPGRRYSSAQALAADLRRFLNHETIQARPADSVERLARWCRRKPLVASLAAALAVALFSGVVSVTWQWRRAEEQAELAIANRNTAESERNAAIAERNRAEDNLQKARGVVDRLTRLAQALTDQPRMQDARQTALEETIRFYEGFLADNSSDPNLRLEAAQAYVRVGPLQYELGQSERAEATLEKGYRLLRELPDDISTQPACQLELARCLNHLGHVQRQQGRSTDSDASYVESVKVLRQLLAQRQNDWNAQGLLANALLNRAVGLRSLSQSTEVEAITREALQLQTSVWRANPRDPGVQSEMALIRDELGLVMLRQNRLPEALQQCSEALDIRAKLAAAAPSVAVYREHVARSRHHLGAILEKSDRSQQAVESYREAVRLRKVLVEDFPKNAIYREQLATSCSSLGLRFWTSERHAEAIETFRLGIRVAPNDMRLLNNLAWTLVTCEDLALRDPAGALELARIATQLEPKNANCCNTSVRPVIASGTPRRPLTRCTERCNFAAAVASVLTGSSSPWHTVNRDIGTTRGAGIGKPSNG